MAQRARATPIEPTEEIDLGELMGCTCARLRRTTRRVTQIYDHALAPAGLTGSQFGLLARLHGAHRAGHPSIAMGMLAERLGMDSTTLTRNLKPLKAAGLVVGAPDPTDRRVRAVALSSEGRARLEAAVPLWRAAQTAVVDAVGSEATVALNGLLDLASAKLAG